MAVRLQAVELVEHAAVNHLPLPPDGDGARAELPEEHLVLGVELDVLHLAGVPELIQVLGVDHVGLRHPGGLYEPRLQAVEVNAAEEDMVLRVLTSGDINKDVLC